MTKSIRRTERWSVVAIRDGARDDHDDAVVVEEPLEIRVMAADGKSTVPITVTMRTPGHDVELAAGLLYTEGLVSGRDDIVDIREAAHPDRPLDNCVEVRLTDGVALDPARTARTLVSTAACGVCGKATIDAVFATGFPPLPVDAPRVSRELLETLPNAWPRRSRCSHRRAGFTRRRCSMRRGTC